MSRGPTWDDVQNLIAKALSSIEAHVNALMGTATSSGSLVPPANGSWTTPAWFISPQTGSDTNAGTSALAPLKTYARLTQLWGTTSPTLRQNTTITFLTSHTDNTDPVVFHPRIANSAVVIVQGALGAAQTIATGVLANVTAKNRGTPQLLQANLGALAVAGLLLVNATRGSARCWVYQNVTGNIWTLTQPLAPETIPATLTFPALVDTFANGDAFTLFKPVQVNLVDVSSTLIDYDGAFNNVLYLSDLTIFDPQGASNDNCYRGAHVWMLECGTQRSIYRTSPTNDQYELTVNVFNDGGWYDDGASDGEFDAIVGGCITGAGQVNASPRTAFDGDIILSPAVLSSPQGVTLALVNISTTLTMGGGRSALIDIAGGYGPTVNGQALWGTGGIQLLGVASFYYKPDFGAEAIMLFKGGITINGNGAGTTACSFVPATPPTGVVTIHAGIAVTPATLDAAAGAAGFGGLAFNPGGASIVASEG
jgi:hypothetical protein